MQRWLRFATLTIPVLSWSACCHPAPAPTCPTPVQPPPVTVIKSPPPCDPLPSWPRPIALGGVKLAQGAKVIDDAAKPPWPVPDHSWLLTPDGDAEIARYVKATTAFYDIAMTCLRGTK